ncbi:fatty-acyl-CoA synthase [Evansella vedderi]|uniref:Fatty-acyl-CoA synthase n=1 Tax=Evansella vedderi TaxID=38282 RepID=A0ABU0A1Q9_9BACI|nr:o-succinylbenzoate--CoA ligase [Evansella vedderi]MDQ0256916.1 fatty-acyl-CoA synthase [Evansella vedderi]
MQDISYWVSKRAKISPDRIALIGEKDRYTYKEMNYKVSKYARVLQSAYGLKKGDRVGILSTNNLEFIILLFAVAKLNAIAVPLNIRLTGTELEYQVKDSGLETLVVNETFKGMGEALKASAELKFLLTFERLTVFAESLKELPAESENIVDADAPFIICYTSGTTGKPKGAVLTQENMFWNALNNTTAIDITSKDTNIVLLPLFHIGGIGLFTFPVLFAGGTVVVLEKFEPEKALRWIEKYNVTLVMGVPTIHDALRKASNFETTNLSSVRWFYSGGAPCPEELIYFYLSKGVAFGQGFGLTETSPTVFMLLEEDYKRKIGSIGRPAMFNDIRIVDEMGEDVVTGEVGELFIKGPNVFKEYWNLPEATANSIQNGWFATGDLVSQDREGFIYIAGRKKEMIISGGENIYPLEIEKVLYELPPVVETAVIGAAHEKWGETPIAIVVLKEGEAISKEDLRRHCLNRLACYKVPTSFKFVSALPRNATGKIDKATLIKQYANEGVKK